MTYTLNNANQLAIHYTTTNLSTNLNTVLNLTNHSYFNLAGENSFPGSAYGQIITINANKYTPTNTTRSRSATWRRVFGTPIELHYPVSRWAPGSRTSAPTSTRPGSTSCWIAQGYDHNWVLNPRTPATTGPLGLNLAATASDPGSGRDADRLD